ncbi:MAG: DUF72 domain-containing protein [Ktedonobacteraceae bacterium]
MIWIGTSGWIYPHWVGRFYPPNIPVHDHLSYYAQHFPTVEVNRSFYRLPTRDQFCMWTEQTARYPGFRFAVKASRYITHMKKLQDAEDSIARLITSASGLGKKLGPFLYQLPPHWHANPTRLEQFIAHLPSNHLAAFEFRDPTWFQPESVQALQRIFADINCTLVTSIGGSLPTPRDWPGVGTFRYMRFHHGAHGTGFSDDELGLWAERLTSAAAEDHDTYVYFNNDAEGHAICDALKLRELMGQLAVLPC